MMPLSKFVHANKNMQISNKEMNGKENSWDVYGPLVYSSHVYA
jgi:hypothetical protein